MRWQGEKERTGGVSRPNFWNRITETMKICTWNVNGLQSSVDIFFNYLAEYQPDIICLQETRIREPLRVLEGLGYNVVWNIGKIDGYSGTAVFYKEELVPLLIRRDFGVKEFDRESRLVSIEFPDFYLVNVYVPHTREKGLHRWTYRLRWDTAFREYLHDLNDTGKQIIIGGDFNVAHNNKSGLFTTEQDELNAMLELGLIDVYREFNGSSGASGRIDYFLISNGIMPRVLSCEIQSDVKGSDHAPILLEIDNINIAGNKPAQEYQIKTDAEYERMWRNINWKKTEDTVLKLQQDIALACRTYKSYSSAIIKTQKKLIHSIEARLFAVRKVSDKVSHPGPDGILWRTDAEKMRAALSLTTLNYEAQPAVLYCIQTKNKERYVHIPTIYDRAMQVLFALVLQPVQESWDDEYSFSAHKSRSAADLHKHLMNTLNADNAPMYIVKTDIKKYYDSICHDWLLEHIPMDNRVLSQFLKAKYIFNGELFPPEDFGIPTGSSISPPIANLTLAGAQRAVYKHLRFQNPNTDNLNGRLFRYADDILVTARTRQDVEKILNALERFVEVRGLKLSQEKTHIIDLSIEGFDFMSRRYGYYNGQIRAAPSESSAAEFERSLIDFITTHRGGQKTLIETINKMIIGWVSYHKITDAAHIFHKIDILLDALLLRWCEVRHPKTKRDKIIERYFRYETDGHPVFTLEHTTDIRVIRLSNTVPVRHRQVDLKKNPFIDIEYFEERTDEKKIRNITGEYKKIWNRQRGMCHICGNPILVDEEKCITQINPEFPFTMSNTAYIHEYCLCRHVETYDTDDESVFLSRFDLFMFLEEMRGLHSSGVSQRSKFLPLAEYFKSQRKAAFCLKFEEIEEILDEPLCRSAYTKKHYWSIEGKYNISACWIANGYEISELKLEKKSVKFERANVFGGNVNLPDIILHGRLKLPVKRKIENAVNYILRENGYSLKVSRKKSNTVKTHRI